MKEVTQDEFYNEIGNKDACVSIKNEHKFPYASVFKLRHGRVLGEVVDSWKDGVDHKHPIVSKYYLAN